MKKLLFGFVFSICFCAQSAQLSARDRLEFIKRQLLIDSNFAPSTPLTELTVQWYQEDAYFVQEELAKRDNGHELVERLQELDLLVQDLLGQNDGKISLNQLNIIADIWTHIASNDTEFSIEEKFLKALHYISEFELVMKKGEDLFQKIDVSKKLKMRNRWQTLLADKYPRLFHASLEGYDYAHSRSFFIPMVSQTGIVPVEAINDSWGFWIDASRTKAYSACWRAIPTNLLNDYDSYRNESSLKVRKHDEAHNQFSGFNGKRAAKSVNTWAPYNATLRSYIEAEEGQRRTLLELAFFMLFHETFKSMTPSKLPQIYLRDKAEVEKIIAEGKLFHKDNVNEEFKGFGDGRALLELHIEMANEMGLACEGSTSEEREVSFARHYLDGLTLFGQLLETHAEELNIVAQSIVIKGNFT